MLAATSGGLRKSLLYIAFVVFSRHAFSPHVCVDSILKIAQLVQVALGEVQVWELVATLGNFPFLSWFWWLAFRTKGLWSWRWGRKIHRTHHHLTMMMLNPSVRLISYTVRETEVEGGGNTWGNSWHFCSFSFQVAFAIGAACLVTSDISKKTCEWNAYRAPCWNVPR